MNTLPKGVHASVARARNKHSMVLATGCCVIGVHFGAVTLRKTRVIETMRKGLLRMYCASVAAREARFCGVRCGGHFVTGRRCQGRSPQCDICSGVLNKPAVGSADAEWRRYQVLFPKPENRERVTFSRRPSAEHWSVQLAHARLAFRVRACDADAGPRVGVGCLRQALAMSRTAGSTSLPQDFVLS